MITVTALALISMMFLLMVRVNDPLVPRAIFGVLNTVLYFPSGAVYPQEGFPGWMRVIAAVDPFTYAVHALKSLLLKNTGFGAVIGSTSPTCRCSRRRRWSPRRSCPPHPLRPGFPRPETRRSPPARPRKRAV